MVLQFHVVIFAEDVEPPEQFLFAFGFPFFQNRPGHAGSDAAGRGDEARVVLFNQALIDARVLAVHALDETERAQFDQIFVAFRIFSQHQLVVANVLFFLRKFLPTPVSHYVKFTAHDGFDAVLPGLRHEFERAEHISVVGDGDGGHVVVFGLFEHLTDVRRAVEKGVFGVAVQVGELHG